MVSSRLSQAAGHGQMHGSAVLSHTAQHEPQAWHAIGHHALCGRVKFHMLHYMCTYTGQPCLASNVRGKPCLLMQPCVQGGAVNTVVVVAARRHASTCTGPSEGLLQSPQAAWCALVVGDLHSKSNCRDRVTSVDDPLHICDSISAVALIVHDHGLIDPLPSSHQVAPGMCMHTALMSVRLRHGCAA